MPGLEAAHAAAACTPAANGAFCCVIGGRNVVLLKEKAIRGPVIAQAEQEFLQACQGGHGLIDNTRWDLNLPIELVNPLTAIRRQFPQQ